MDANKFNLQKFKEALRSFRRRDFYYYFPSLYKKKKDLGPVKITRELHEYYKSIRRPDSQPWVMSDHHTSLKPAEQYAEDSFNLAYHGMQYMGLRDIKILICEWDDDAISPEPHQVYAILKKLFYLRMKRNGNHCWKNF